MERQNVQRPDLSAGGVGGDESQSGCAVEELVVGCERHAESDGGCGDPSVAVVDLVSECVAGCWHRMRSSAQSVIISLPVRAYETPRSEGCRLVRRRRALWEFSLRNAEALCVEFQARAVDAALNRDATPSQVLTVVCCPGPEARVVSAETSDATAVQQGG